MKQVIKNALATVGFKIERLDNPNPLEHRYHQLLKEIYGCYQYLHFNSLPDIDDSTVKLLARLDGTQISEAIYVLNALQQTKEVKGEICEFGVAQGYTSSLIASVMRSSSKLFWLFDSFEGLPAPTAKDKLKDDIFNLQSMEAYQGTMKHGQEVVLGNLQNVGFPKERIRVVDGFIEKTILSAELPKTVSFAYVDFDFYEPIKIALNYLNNVLSKNGIVIIDDYDFFSEGAKIAVDEFFNDNKSAYKLEFPIPPAGKFAILTKII